jgi:hypothetical protein
MRKLLHWLPAGPTAIMWTGAAASVRVDARMRQ